MPSQVEQKVLDILCQFNAGQNSNTTEKEILFVTSRCRRLQQRLINVPWRSLLQWGGY